MEFQAIPTQTAFADRVWPFWPVVPIYPYSQRQTLRREVLSNTIWTFEQLQGIFYVVVPIRMTVIRLMGGGLLVYAPVAPTPECICLMRDLESQHGEVRYIILPTISGVEHKVFVGPFARQFPQAQVFVAPDQWSYPLDLPLSWLGLPRQRTYLLPRHNADLPFSDEFDYGILGPIWLGPGTFEEVAFFHRPSQTLLVTDTLISIPPEPPAILHCDPYPLLFHSREHPHDRMVDNGQHRRKGWQRISLFATYFSPSSLQVVSASQAWQDSQYAPDRSRHAYFGLYPFRWNDSWRYSFEVLQGNGRLLVAPILQTLILNRAPQETIAWANHISQWPIQRVIPCHFDAPINTTSAAVKSAFNFLQAYLQPASSRCTEDHRLLPEPDLRFLKTLDTGLVKRGIIPPSHHCAS